MIRLTDTRPPCSACFNQHFDGTRYVDFDAANDRGFSNGIALDDLILCEQCVKRAAIEVGYGDMAEAEVRLKDLDLAFEREKYRADQLEKYAGELELAFDQRPEKIAHPRRRGRQPKEATA